MCSSTDLDLKQLCMKKYRDDISLFSYKIKPSQPLWEDGTTRRYSFASECEALLKDNPGIFNVTLFSDEVHCYFDCYIDEQNVQSWVL
jgi:hypothetical protein